MLFLARLRRHSSVGMNVRSTTASRVRAWGTGVGGVNLELRGWSCSHCRISSADTSKACLTSSTRSLSWREGPWDMSPISSWLAIWNCGWDSIVGPLSVDGAIIKAWIASKARVETEALLTEMNLSFFMPPVTPAKVQEYAKRGESALCCQRRRQSGCPTLRKR